jgi:hypothetical protein
LKNLIAQAIPALANETLAIAQSRAPTIQSLESKKTERIKLLRLRHIKVLRSKQPATLADLKEEFLKLAATPRYYLISVKAQARAHAIAVVSTLKSGMLWGTNGAIYYYDPNLKFVVKFDEAQELNLFLERTSGDYQGVNYIWEVAHA